MSSRLYGPNSKVGVKAWLPGGYRPVRDFAGDTEGGVRVRGVKGLQPIATIPQLHGRREIWLLNGVEYIWRRPGAPPKAMQPLCSQTDDGIWFVDAAKVNVARQKH